MKGHVWGGLLATTVVTGLVTSPVGAAFTASAPAHHGVRSAHDKIGAAADRSFGPSQRAAAMADAKANASSMARSLGLTTSQALVVKDVIRDADGTTHIRYDRTYNGLPVVGGDLIVHRSPGGVTRGVDWGTQANLSSLATVRPSVAAPAAERTAKRTSGLAETPEAPGLAVWALGKTPRLAWKTVVEGTEDGGPARDVVYVDAATGGRIAGWSELQTADATGTGNSLYSGTVSIHTDSTPSGSFEMRDTTRGNQRVTDMLDTDVNPPGPLFTDADNAWGNGSATNRQSAAVDAQYGAAVTWDFYKDTFNRTGIRNDGVGALSRVHFDDDNANYPGQGPGYDNAFWNDSCFCMTYGDGQNFFNPLVSLDVAGHEMSHGVTSHTADLIYLGESGGLNEATSDIFGSMVEFKANNANDPGDYYIGEEVTAVNPFFLRRMDHPSVDGDSFDCYTPQMGRFDVHNTSGPANRFFYLLSEGTGTKIIGGLQHDGATCTGATISGIGRLKAGKIWYRALTVYMTAGTDYRHARDATIRAARDLFPNACRTVAATWTSVKVKKGAWSCGGQLNGGTGLNYVKNGGFESGKVKWSAPADVITKPTLSGDSIARSGRWTAFLNGFEVPNTQTLKQTIKLPRAKKLTLAYFVLGDSSEPDSVSDDTLKVQVVKPNGRVSTLRTHDNRGWDDSYHRFAADLSGLRGEKITLRFVGREDNGNATSWLVDDVSIRKG